MPETTPAFRIRVADGMEDNGELTAYVLEDSGSEPSATNWIRLRAHDHKVEVAEIRAFIAENAVADVDGVPVISMDVVDAWLAGRSAIK